MMAYHNLVRQTDEDIRRYCEYRFRKLPEGIYVVMNDDDMYVEMNRQGYINEMIKLMIDVRDETIIAN